MSDPVLPITLDLQFPAREFRLRIPAGTSPVVAVTLLVDGDPFDPEGWTGQLCHFEAWDAGEFAAVASDGADGHVMRFPCDPANTDLVGERYASVLLTKAGKTVEFGRGRIAFVGSPPTAGADLSQLVSGQLQVAEGWKLVVGPDGQISAEPTGN